MNTFCMKTCFVCDSEFWTEKRIKTTRVNFNQESNYKDEQETENEEEKDWILFWKCVNLPQVEIDEYKREFYNKSKSLIETETELFSLCPKCSVVKGKILVLYEQLESIQQQLEGFSVQLSTTIKNTQEIKYNKNNSKNNSINTRKSERGKINNPNQKPNSNEGIQRLRQFISDQIEKPLAQVSKSKKSGVNSHVLTNSDSISSLVPLNFDKITTKETEEEREEFNVSDDENDDGYDFTSSNIKQEVESESEGDHENPYELSQEEEEQEEEEESDKDAEADENVDIHNDFFYGIYDFLSASIVDTNTNPNSEQDQNLNETINENENPSLENNNNSEVPETPEAQDQPRRKKARRKVQTPEEWIANIQKRKRMLGEEYSMVKRYRKLDGSWGYSRHNTVKPARVLGAPCRCSKGHPNVGKGRECGHIQEEERQLIFHKFWKTMDWDEKKMWVKSAVVVMRPKTSKNMVKKKKKKKPKNKKGRGKRKRGDEETSDSSDSESDDADEMNVSVNVNVNPNVKEHKKEVTLKYFLPLRDHRKIVVCKPLFLSTLGIREGALHGWLKESAQSLKKNEQTLQNINNKSK